MGNSPVAPTNSHQHALDSNPYAFRVEVLDYIPIVSIASGVARVGLGALQVTASVAQDVASFIDFCCHPSQGSSIENGTSLFLHGKANMIRGSIAIWPILGNITLYLYDHSSLAKDWERRVAAISITTAGLL